jgi:glycine cleavage system H protein
MVEILYEPYSLSLPEVGQSLARGDTFGTIEGYKMQTDLLSPVTGVIIEVNEDVRQQGRGGQGGYIALVNGDPYNSGWMIVVQLIKPEEINDLLTAQSYLNRLVEG